MSDITGINQLEDNFKELQQYSDSQFHLINKLNEQIDKLKSENESLKIMLEQNLPNITLQTSDLGIGISNEQLICETQLLLLKDSAITRPLTMEEVKKVQILTDVLMKCKDQKKHDPFGITKISDEDLLKVVDINV